MKQQYYKIAQNAFTVSASGEALAVWQALDSRFGPFESPIAMNDDASLHINIRVDSLPACEARLIYEPRNTGVGFLASRALQMSDGTLILEFRPVAGGEPRLMMKMNAELNRADIILAPDGDDDDCFFVSHAVMIAFLLATAGTGTLIIHASSILYDGKAYLFQGKSGTGKSTHAALWTSHIPDAELLNDDHPVIRFTPDGVPMAYGSPWSGKTDCYRNLSAPVGAFVRIVRDSENALTKLAPLQAYASLTASVFYLPFLSEGTWETRHKTIERLVGSVPCCEMHCRPDRDAAVTCRRALIPQP